MQQKMHLRSARRWNTSIKWLLALLILASSAMAPSAAEAAPAAGAVPPAQQVDTPAAPAWMEPRGISVVDLAGIAPEDMLRDSMVVYSPGNALAYYESGSRSGSTVTVRVRFISKDNRGATCLGMPGHFDTWPTVMPAGTLRILAGATDVTRNIVQRFELVPAGQIQPVSNATAVTSRYPVSQVTAQYDGSGALLLPANMGCKLTLTSGSTPLTGVFTMQTQRLVAATLLGSQSMQFRSYIGPGYSGQLASLQQQMSDKYGNRHDDLAINPPGGSEFVWVKYPHTPVAAWDPASPAGGTYRIRRNNGRLSVDHENSMAIPLNGQYQDSDFTPGDAFLPYFTDAKAVSSPEYFVPVGVAYDPCMTNGGCPASLLQTIYDARMNMTVYYLRIERVQPGLQQISLAQVGQSWSAGNQSFAQLESFGSRAQPAAPARAGDPLIGPSSIEQQHKLYMPAIIAIRPLEPDNPGANCPCGWFAADGRMVDLVQPQ